MITKSAFSMGIQSFKEMHTNNYLYVDKTEQIFNLIETGRGIFSLSYKKIWKKPFSFNNEPFFSGKKERFVGLKIADLEREWITYPAFILILAEKNTVHAKIWKKNHIVARNSTFNILFLQKFS